MKRKTIALCVSGYHPESESKIIAEIIQNCRENNVNLLIFISLMKNSNYPDGIDTNSNLVRGETQIFNLINYKMIDGLILFSGTIYKKEIVQEIEKQCKKNNVPIVNVNNPGIKLEHNVFVENSHAMELVVEHLIKVHKLTKINFIGGFPDNKETIERLTAYKNILTKYKIPIEEKRIAYGHFWKHSVECVKEFEKNGLPQAIVCASDTMAILVSDYLKNKGYRVPKDIIVTGYDGTSDADVYEPALTTVRPKFSYAGYETFVFMQKLMDGQEDIPENVCIDSELIVQGSCGCKKKKKHFHNYIDEKYLKQSVANNFITQLTRADVLFSDEETSDDLFDHISASLDVFSFRRFTYCIDSDLETRGIPFFTDKKKKTDIPPKVICEVPYYIPLSQREVFSSKKILWYDFLNEDEPVLKCFSPLYFRNRSLGYIAYEPVDFEKLDSDNFQLWLFNAAEKIGVFYLTRELEELNEKDHFTGLYNRRGMDKHFAKVYEELNPEGEYISIICIDIDFLKKINDNYGHEGGDNAITQISNAIKHSFSKNSVCVRTGGDEFCILTHSKKEDKVVKSLKKLTEYLNDYNKNSKVDYNVMCSCGYCTKFSKDFTSFKDMQKAADKQLYEVKDKHHDNKFLKNY